MHAWSWEHRKDLILSIFSYVEEQKAPWKLRKWSQRKGLVKIRQGVLLRGNVAPKITRKVYCR